MTDSSPSINGCLSTDVRQEREEEPWCPFLNLSVTSVNALAPLSQTPWPNPITLMVNGRGFFNVGSPPDFSVSGTAITWLSTEYSVSPGDDVVAIYYYLG